MAKDSSHPAFCVSNIKNNINVILDIDDLRYLSWANAFFTACRSYRVADHLDDKHKSPENTDPTYSEWEQLDDIVVSWIYSTVDSAVLRLVKKPGTRQTALQLWTAIGRLFHDNIQSRALQLKSEFRHLEKGDMSMHDYISKLKTLADALSEIGSTIDDSDLVLQICHGLPDSFAATVAVLTEKEPLPDFLSVRHSLIREEQRQNRTSSSTRNSITDAHAPTALVASESRGSGRSRGGSSSSQQPQQFRYARHTRNIGFQQSRNRGRGRGRSSTSPPWVFAPPSSYYRHLAPPMSYYGWALPGWFTPPVSNNSQGLLGPRPAVQSPQSTSPNPYAHELAKAFSGVTLSEPYDDGSSWFMDSGATSHFTANNGPIDHCAWPLLLKQDTRRICRNFYYFSDAK